MPAGQTTIAGADANNAAVILLAGSDGTNRSPGHTLFDVNGLAVGTTGNPLAVGALPVGTANVGSLQLADGVTPSQRATVALFHASDNQQPGGTGYGLLTGGVAQVLNPVGNIDRQRETGFDNVPAAGVATGTQQLAGPLLTTTVTSGAITANAVAQTVTLATVSFLNRGVLSSYQPGTTLLIDAGNANQEYVYITLITGSVVTAIFTKAHAAAVSVAAFSFSQARDATIPDGSTPAGIGAGAAYLFNAASSTVEFERSFAGELMGAKGTGAAIAAEYGDTSGGPPLASGVVSGMRLLPAQSLMGAGFASVAITSTTVGNSTLVFGSAAATNLLAAGHAVQLSGGTTAETVFVSLSWVPGSSATVPLQSPVVFAAQVLANWSVFAANGPALAGFLPHGVGIEEEAVYDPVTKLYYIERSATQDGVPPQNVVMESGALWNGTGMDRMRSVTGDALPATGIEASADLLYNGATFDRPRAVAGDGQAATGLPAEVHMLWNGTSYDRQPGNAGNGAKVISTPGTLAVADPDISTVTTGGTAVIAFAATHVTKGGWIKNPTAATAPLFIRLTGAAATVESGGSIAIAAGQTYTLPPFTGAVSVNSTDSGHVFSGVGFQ